MKTSKIILLVIAGLIMTGCFGSRVSKSVYFDSQVKIKQNDGLFILPTLVVKEIKTGSETMENMFDTLIFTAFKDSGFEVKPSESLYAYLKEKNNSISEFKKLDYKDIDQKVINEICQKNNIKFLMRLTVFAHVKEELMNDNNYFLSLKVYTSEGREAALLSAHYQGEESLSSSKIVGLVEDLIKKIIKNS